MKRKQKNLVFKCTQVLPKWESNAFQRVLLLAVLAGAELAMSRVALQPSDLKLGVPSQWKPSAGRLVTSMGTKVGINADIPEAALHVNSQEDARLGIRHSGGIMVGRSTHDHRNLLLDGNEIMARLGVDYGPLYINDEGGAVYFQRNAKDSTDGVAIEEDGRVVIGKRNKNLPNAKLTVDGNIIAKKIVVTVEGFPDYVFADGYELMPLEAVEAFIKEHHHLPHVPPAREVETSGADLGELNKSLLKTIEELTLHTIKLDKKVKRQEQRLTKLEKKVNSLLK